MSFLLSFNFNFAASISYFDMMRKVITFDRFIRGLILVVGILLIYLLLLKLSGVLIPFFVAWIAAYMLYPLVCFFQYRCELRNRLLSIVVALFSVIGLLSVACYFIVPPVIDEFARVKVIVLEYVGELSNSPDLNVFMDRFVWKNLDFNANFAYMIDFDINNATAYVLSSSEGNKNKFNNVLAEFSDGWQYNDIDGSITGTKGDVLYKCYYASDKNPVDIYKEGNPNRTLWNPTDVTKKITHSYFIEDGSFLRCNDVTVGYTLPKDLTKKWGISKARFYVSASNLFIITGYSGYDPEVDIQTSLKPSMDLNRYPRNRKFVFGTNITF